MAFVGTRVQTTTWFKFNPSHRHKLRLRRAPKISMSTMQGKSKRPICPSCSKPTRTCLCSRILTPGIDNSVHVTILQHAQERKHPLNSTRIARLGLKNLTVATVSDVNFEARLLIRLLDPNSQPGHPGNVPNGLFSRQSWEIGETQKLFSEKNSNLIDTDSAGKCGLRNDLGYVLDSLSHAEDVKQESISDGAVVSDEVEKNAISPNCDLTGGVHEENGGLAITVAIGKYGAVNSLSHIWMAQAQCQFPKLSFDKILAYPEACEALSKGFWVKKFQMKQLNREVDLEECEEFELEVRPGSVLLFPSDKAVNIGDLDAIGFEVKNLIVLDGTWAKAKRIYSENPWLNILPHVKLEVNEISLYSDVRHQPKAGYLSTIESIVFALKAVGENHEGLDGLLDTFESMVGDQRRCKEERLSKHLSS
ncbi:DTW domain-containing protein 2 [Spatholobus suberectus]|nr:DTW domain-containing protein 2 [Spatholobus suberectus]